MNAQAGSSSQWREASSSASPIFDSTARQAFARSYPESAHQLTHALNSHPLLEIEALAHLAEGLPEASLEYNRGDLPIGITGKPDATALSIADTIRQVREANSWAVLKNVEQVPSYRSLLLDLLEELKPQIEATTGEMLTPQGFVFISSPNAITPYHFDPEHNILLQIEGSKVMTQFPAGDPRFAPDEVHEQYHLGGPRELAWDDRFLQHGHAFTLGPGDAVYVPVMAPHFVQNGPRSSISLSITWRSEWSYDESGARCFNGTLRGFGFRPKAPARWPVRNTAKSLSWRLWRRAFIHD